MERFSGLMQNVGYSLRERRLVANAPPEQRQWQNFVENVRSRVHGYDSRWRVGATAEVITTGDLVVALPNDSRNGGRRLDDEPKWR